MDLDCSKIKLESLGVRTYKEGKNLYGIAYIFAIRFIN